MDQDSFAQSDQTPAKPTTRGQLGRLGRLCIKEIREILRDRRTIVTLVLMPLLVYPILSLTFNRFLLTSFDAPSEDQPVLEVAFDTADGYPLFIEWYQYWAMQLGGAIPLTSEDDEPQLEFVKQLRTRSDVEAGVIDMVMSVRRSNPANLRDPRINIEFVYAENTLSGIEAYEFLSRRLNAFNDRYDREVLSSNLPIRVSTDPIELTAEEAPATPFASFVPLMLILMTITGAVYPAIDLTAGERERGTMEALIAAPIPRLGLLLAKYCAVLIVAVLTATANLIAMTITLFSSPLGGLLFGEAGITWEVMLQIYFLMILFASFFSAVLLAMTSFARSFKEAQAYLIPLMLVALGPGILSLIPGIELTALYAVLPLLNLVLLARDTIEGVADPTMAVMAITSTITYALAAISLAARIFGTDAILYGSQASWTDLFRAPDERPTASNVAGAMLSLALLFPLQFIAANEIGKLGSNKPSQRVSAAFSTAADAELAMPDGAAQLLVIDVPDGVSVAEGNSLEEGRWSLATDQADTLTLEAIKPQLSEFSIGLQWFDADGSPLAASQDQLTFSTDQLEQGISIGRQTLTQRLLFSALLTFVLFVGVPLISIMWQRVRWREGLRLHRPNHWLAFLPAAILGLSLWPFAHEIVVFGFEFGIGGLDGKIAIVERLATELRGLSPLLILFAMAITPAVCEEFFFRGFLLQGLLRELKPRHAILISAVLFGAFHLIGNSTLAPERLLPSTFLGLALGWVCVRTGSVYPGMLFHAVHNGLLMMITYYQPWLADNGWLVSEGDHLPLTWLGTAGVAAVIALVSLAFLSRRASKATLPNQLSESN